MSVVSVQLRDVHESKFKRPCTVHVSVIVYKNKGGGMCCDGDASIQCLYMYIIG